jgi:Mn-dependent DtxR family transcriptional regulator
MVHNMEEYKKEEPDLLKIVKEDILEDLCNKGGRDYLSSIEPEIKVSKDFIKKNIRMLEKNGLLECGKNINGQIVLTEKGAALAKKISVKHSVLEKYFFKIRKDKKEAYKLASIFEHYVSVRVLNNVKKLTTLKEDGEPLTNLERNETGLISDAVLNSGLFERFVSMGIVPGENIRIKNELPNILIVETENKKFALSKELARCVKVIRE